jgi:hypothetical protein
MGKIFPVVGNPRDEHGVVSVVTIGAENILVPVVWRRPVLQDQGDLLNTPKRLNKREYFDSLRLHDSRRPRHCG